ncbi:hypothetical protein J5N97_018845 [Dioscorea zingiberensis]|uniref:E3 ubiquitin-protein ligase RMA n=1 Tax=Dioscorea zingiberensis TaxID=325984 RepID=A0A9D5CD17_9LILI|nr:hypothetical protein J5N97_018845 [Dioscorea zingiberensis]
MADEGNLGGIADMDLNLNLGLPPSYLHGVLDLGSALAINSSSTAEEENRDEIKSPEPEVPSLPDDGTAAPDVEDLAVAPLLTPGPLNEPEYVEPLQTVAANEGIPENSTSPIVGRPSSPATFAPFFRSWPLTQGRRENGQSSFGQPPFNGPGFVFPRLIESPFHSPVESPIQHPGVQPLEAPERLQEEKGNSPVQRSEESSEETKNNAVAEFECNVCFDTPKDPVVTSCGHLFCWPCLHEWIQRNQDDKQCPMCKGELSESNIIPIYGRGNSVIGGKGDNKVEQGGKHSPVITLRPRGSRFESFNQWFEAIFEVADDDTAATWRGLLDEGMRTVFQRVVEPSIREMFNTCYVRLMEMQMDEGEFQIGANIGDILRQRVRPRQRPQLDGTGLPSSSTEECLWRWFILSGLAKTQRLIAVTNLDRMFERISNNPFSGVTIAAGSPTEHQPSASSTMAVIQGDVVVPNAAAEPNSAESSLRRRMRNTTSGLLNGDDGDGHPNTRRRLD